MEGRGDGNVMVVRVFSFDLLHVQESDRRQSTTAIWSARQALAVQDRRLIFATVKTDLWVTVSTIA